MPRAVTHPVREDVRVPNDYSRQWFDVFLATVPSEWTTAEVEGVARRLPLPEFRRTLDICCGPGRHARYLADKGYEVTGIDRDADAIEQARATIHPGTFVELDQRELGRLDGVFDAALVLWQSFGYFEPADNDRVLADVARLLRPGGRLLLDLFHLGYFDDHQGRTIEVRDPRCAAITNTLDRTRLTSTIEYVDGTEESMQWELFTPDDIVARAAQVGFQEIERCAWWDERHRPCPDEQRFQVVLERT
jgi:SAM-dependent methyltransferase